MTDIIKFEDNDILKKDYGYKKAKEQIVGKQFFLPQRFFLEKIEYFWIKIYTQTNRFLF